MAQTVYNMRREIDIDIQTIYNIFLKQRHKIVAGSDCLYQGPFMWEKGLLISWNQFLWRYAVDRRK